MSILSLLILVVCDTAIEAKAEVLRVDPNAPEAFATIQQALDAAVEGDTIVVADGIYPVQENYYGWLTHIGKAITLKSEHGAQQCILDGRQSSGLVYVSNTASGVIVEGFTVRNGNRSDGGAFYSNTAGFVTIRDCRFENNTAGNGDGGAAYLGRGRVDLVRCVFTANHASDDGGALAGAESAALVLVDCTFSDNSSSDNGAAVYCRDGSAVFRRCAFYGNRADSNGGAVYIRDQESHLLNCVYSGNRASDDGGAVYVRESWTTVVQCTFSANHALRYGGAWASSSQRSIVLYGTILWGNEDSTGRGASAQLYNLNPILAYCCIQNWPTTDTILTQDPLFMDADGLDDTVGTPDDDLRLRPDSPCIDGSGLTSVSWPFEGDFNHKMRLSGAAVDMGALECGDHDKLEISIHDKAGAPIVVNEVMTHSRNGPDWIELHNTTDYAINIGGWIITDRYYSIFDLIDPNGIPWKGYTFAPDTWIDAHSTIVRYQGQDLPFGFNASGDDVRLLSAVGRIPTGYQQIHELRAAPSDVSLIRHTNSLDWTEYVPSEANTPNAVNSAPVVGPVVITEIKYDLKKKPVQFIELLNISDSPVTLYESGRHWSLDGTITYDFSAEARVVLDPNERIVVSDYPDLLPLLYPEMPADVRVIGPFISGALLQEGGIVTLVALDQNNSEQIPIEDVMYNVGLGLYPDGWEQFWLYGYNDYHGTSLQRLRTGDFANDPKNWTIAIPTPGY